MIRRVFWVGLFTGLSQLISLITISYILRNLGEETSGYMGLIDSYTLIIAVLISFGIQLSVNRNIAIQKNWFSSYVLGQKARVSLSFLIVLFGIFSYIFAWDLSKWVFFAAPLIALNGDYALYGNGKPIEGARLSFFRVAIPNLAILFSSFYIGTSAIYVYILFCAIGILNSGLFASKINRVPYFFSPRSDFYKLYLKYFKLGVFQVAYVAMITGILALTKSFYSLAVIGLVYGILKYFEIFKGVLRILIQSFFKEFTLKETNLKIDKAGMLLGGFIIIPTIIFNNSTLELIYADSYKGIEGILPIFGTAMLIATIKTSADMQVMINKKDNVNLIAYLVAFSITLLTSIILSYTDYNVFGIGIGIVLGELILLIILGLNLDGIRYFSRRFRFFIKLSPVLILPFLLKILVGDKLYLLLISGLLYIVWVFLFYRKLIFDSSFLIQNESNNLDQ